MGNKTPRRERRTLRYPPSMKRPKDWLRFVQTDTFEQCWAHIGLDDDDLRALEIAIMINPDGPPVIQGTGGVRKGRFSPERWPTGKRGGARYYYLYIPSKGLVLLLFVHVKAKQETITDEQKKALRMLVREILNSFE